MSEIEFCNQLLSFERSLKKFAYSLTQKKEDANDLVQETLLKGLMNRGKFVPDGSLQAWTFTIMKNTFINEYRRSSRQRSYHDQTKDLSFVQQAEYSYSDYPDSAYSVKEITRIIEQLEEKFRIPFKMYVQGFRYKEIAEELNLNIGTVKSRIFLSRKQLKSELNR
jgi:RNA polymerase sigma-70 factor (ECF subfamily)